MDSSRLKNRQGTKPENIRDEEVPGGIQKFNFMIFTYLTIVTYIKIKI